MSKGKKYTIECRESDRRLLASDIERIESLLATFIAKAILEGRIMANGHAVPDDAATVARVADLVARH